MILQYFKLEPGCPPAISPERGVMAKVLKNRPEAVGVAPDPPNSFPLCARPSACPHPPSHHDRKRPRPRASICLIKSRVRPSHLATVGQYVFPSMTEGSSSHR